MFPVDTGISKVDKVTPEGELEVYAQGLTMVLGIAFDDQGQLYVLESSTVDNEFPLPGAGRVVRVAEAGELEVIATGLIFPIGMTLGSDGFLKLPDSLPLPRHRRFFEPQAQRLGFRFGLVHVQERALVGARPYSMRLYVLKRERIRQRPARKS